MNNEKYQLTDEEIVLIERYRGEQDAINRKVKYLISYRIRMILKTIWNLFQFAPAFINSLQIYFQSITDGAKSTTFVIFVHSV